MAKVSVKQVEKNLIAFALTCAAVVLGHMWGHDAVRAIALRRRRRRSG